MRKKKNEQVFKQGMKAGAAPFEKKFEKTAEAIYETSGHIDQVARNQRKTKDMMGEMIDGQQKDHEQLLEKKCRSKKISIYRKMCNDLENYFQYEKDVSKEFEKNIKTMEKHKNDLEYCQKQAFTLVTDISYMETIRTLTYGNS